MRPGNTASLGMRPGNTASLGMRPGNEAVSCHPVPLAVMEWTLLTSKGGHGACSTVAVSEQCARAQVETRHTCLRQLG